MHKVAQVLAVVFCCGFCGVSTAAAAARRVPVAAEVTPLAPAASERDGRLAAAEAARYAAREAAAPELAKFKGGGGVDIYVGGSALAIALLVVLLVLLI